MQNIGTDEKPCARSGKKINQVYRIAFLSAAAGLLHQVFFLLQCVPRRRAATSQAKLAVDNRWLVGRVEAPCSCGSSGLAPAAVRPESAGAAET